MYNLGDQFKFDLEKAKTNSQSIVKGQKFRISILTESLIRLEYSNDGVFNDLPTEIVWYRNFDKPNFEIQENGNILQITTKFFTLVYNKEKNFYGGKINAASNLKVTSNINGKVWYYTYPEVRIYDAPSFKMEDEKVSRGSKSLFSLDGFVTIDDSKSNYFDEYGCIIKNENKKIDIYLFMYGTNFFTCLKDYYKITGYPSLLPRYAFGNWWSRNITYSSDSLNRLVEDFKENDIPISAILLNNSWSKRTEDNKPSFSFDSELYSNPSEVIKQLHNSNIKLGLTINPMNGFSKIENSYESLKQYLTPNDKGIIPFNVFNVRDVDAYLKLVIHPLDNLGVDFYNIDYFSPKNLEELMLLKHYNLLDIKRNKSKRPILYGYNSTYASHRYSILYYGRSIVSWDTLKQISTFNCAATNIGVSWWSHDIGGFYKGIEDNELFTRFIQLGVFCPILKLNSDKGKYYKRYPWQWGIKTYNITKSYLNIRHKLIPYLYSENYRYANSGVPLIQPLYYQYPSFYDDPLYSNEYYFGSQLFISPIVSHKDYVMNRTIHKFYIPEGTWYDYVTGKKFPGGRKYVSFFRDEDYPVFAKAGAIIPLSMNTENNNIDAPKDLEIQIFPGRNNVYNLYEDDGISNLYLDGKYLLTNIEYNYMPNNYTVIIRPISGTKGVIYETRNYKINFRNTKKSNNVLTYVNNKKIENNSYVSGNDFIVEIKNVPTLEQLTINCKGTDIEIDALRIINDDIEGILNDLPIDTEIKEHIDKIIFNAETTIKQKRLQIRRINNKNLERKYVELFLKLLEYISQV